MEHLCTVFSVKKYRSDPERELERVWKKSINNAYKMKY